MTIVITGSSGFIGKALVSYLLEKNCSLVLLIRDDKKNDPDKNIQFLKYDSSLTDEHILNEIRKHKPDVFIHMAWKGTSGADRNEDYQLNYNISLTIQSVLLAYSSGCKQWIGTGSQAEYGLYNKKISETDVTSPIIPYGKAKLLAGNIALEMCRQLYINGTWNRIFSVYGPGDNEKYFIPYIINSFKSSVKPLLTKCEQEWDFLFVEDLAEAIYNQIVSHAQGVFNICSGKTILLKNVVEMIQANFHGKNGVNYGAVPYSKNQIMLLSGNCDRLKETCGWRPKTTLEEGIIKTINYYLHEGV